MSFEDREFGLVNQKNIKPILERFFEDELTDTSLSDRYDFKGKKNVYEVKSRRNAYQKYPTTLIGEDKAGENVIFVFYFTDGVYYITYNQEEFKSFECKPFRRFRQGVRDVEKPYYYIPIECLRRIR